MKGGVGGFGGSIGEVGGFYRTSGSDSGISGLVSSDAFSNFFFSQPSWMDETMNRFWALEENQKFKISKLETIKNMLNNRPTSTPDINCRPFEEESTSTTPILTQPFLEVLHHHPN